MACADVTQFLAIRDEYNRLREDCKCDGIDSELPSPPCLPVGELTTECMIPALKEIYTNVTNKMFDPLFGTMHNGNCYDLTHNSTYWGYIKYIGDWTCYETGWDQYPALSNHLYYFWLWMQSIQCTPQSGSIDMGAYFPEKPTPCYPHPCTDKPPYDCSDPYAGSCNHGEQCLGPWCFDIGVFGDTDVDDDLLINGYIIENGGHTDPGDPCPDCNHAHNLTYAGSGDYMAYVEAETELCVDVVDQQGTNVGAEGTLEWERITT